MISEGAQKCGLQCKQNVPQLLASVDLAEKEQSRAALQDSISSTLAHLSGHMRPCRKLPEVDAWLSSFQEIAFRYEFLVLD